MQSQVINLRQFGLQPLTDFQSLEINGGEGFWDKFVTYLAEQAVEHWSDIKKGFVDGFSAASN